MFKIYMLRQKLIIICATYAGRNLSVELFKIIIFKNEICATPAGANLGVLSLKISVLRQEFGSHCLCHSCGSKFRRFSV